MFSGIISLNNINKDNIHRVPIPPYTLDGVTNYIQHKIPDDGKIYFPIFIGFHSRSSN